MRRMKMTKAPRAPTRATVRAASDVPLPLYHQVYMVLRQHILDGHYPAGQAMPTEQELERDFNVSRITIRRAFDRLVSEGLVARRRGSGSFPQPPAGRARVHANVRGLIENLIAMGLKTQVRLVEFGYEPAPAVVAAHFGVPPRTIVQKAVRVRVHKGTPFSYLTTYVPEDIGRSYGEGDLTRQPLLVLLEKAGVKIAGADQTITAKLADGTVAPLLETDVGAALICIRRLVFAEDGRPIEYIEALYRPDLYEYSISLSRVADGVAKTSLWAPAATRVDGAMDG